MGGCARWWFVLCGALVLGCGGEDAAPCPAGTLRVCTCPDGRESWLMCGADGQPAGVCACGGVPGTGAMVGTGGDTGTGAMTGTGGDMGTGAMVGTGGDMGTGGSGTGGTDGAGGGMAADPSSGCGQAPLASGEHTLMAGGLARRYLLRVPPGYDNTRSYPLVFGFHGATSSAEGFQSAFYGGLEAPVGSEAVIVYGHAQGAEGQTAWQSMGDSDLAYFDAVLEEVSSSLCIDGQRIFATGHSSGGYFSNYLGCARGEVLRAIAPLAAGGPFAFNGCAGQVAVWIEHGDMDDVVSLSQGEGSRDHWVAANQCNAGSSAPVDPSPCVAYADCDAGYPVHFCVSAGGGHEPRATLTGLGAWAFFDAL